jgi:hypothetical protein
MKKLFAALLTLSMFVGAPALAEGKKAAGQFSPGSKCRVGNPEFKDYVSCMTYNKSIGNTDASRYCQRQCPRG